MDIDELHARALATIGAGLAPPPDLRPSEWVEAYRRLDASSALPGPFSFSATPYFRQPLDDLSTTSGIKTVVVCAGAQLGKTELLLSAVCYWIANDPRPIMTVWPTVDAAMLRVSNDIPNCPPGDTRSCPPVAP
ncbi:phage terminase large subunit family protein, partial [Azospirillum argentinense]